MISSRLRIATLIALSCPLAALGQAESTSGGSAPAAPPPPPSSSFSSTSSTPSTGASSSFGTSGTGTTSGSIFDVFSSGSTSESPSTAGPANAVQEAAPSFTLPGFYGQGSTTFFGGSGRLARPDFEMGLSFSIGYDDNIFQTPSDVPSFGVSGIVDEIPPNLVLVEEAKPPGLAIRRGPDRVVDPINGLTVPTFFFVETPGKEAVFEEIDLSQERKGSFLTRSNLNLQMQQFTRRSLFTLDFSGGRTFYWDKDEDPIDYNANFLASYLYRFSPRVETSSQINVAYISQPDLSRANTPEQPTVGDIINTLARTNLTYRFTPRVSSTVTASYSGLRYTEKTEQTGNYDIWTFGLEARYLWKPRWTLLAEVRHAITAYETNPTLDATTEYFLVGSEFILSPRLTGSLRLGMNFKSFEVGNKQSAPYVESSVSYRSTARSSVTWTNRFGFEESSSPNDERLVYRSTIAYSYAFTPRLRGSAAINLLHEISTNTVTDVEFAQDTFDSTIGLDYQVTRRFSLNASYAFTITSSNTGTSDYYRNRIYFGGQMNF